jgi:pimeloyl-ACP methyl ester carboxylesterase
MFDELGITLAGTPFLAPYRFTALEIAHDYRIRGLQAEYRNDGIGVPLVAYRHNNREQPVEPMDRYYSFQVDAAATAVIRPCGTLADWRNHPVTLTLFDPFETRTAQFPSPGCAGEGPSAKTGRSVTLATDRTTPLTVQEQYSSLEVLRRVGVFRPDAVMRSERGLYMYQPYRPGKIPVVLVHGIYSSPSTWKQTVNHLQNDPVLAERYQVWLFLYPTGAPLTASAADLRKALRDAIAFFDPCGNDPALQQMVLVGHSMGALMGKMAVMDSSDALWRAYFDKPFDEVRAAPEVKERLEETLFLTPEPYVQRLVMISAPHRGSVEACFFPGPLIQIAIHRPKELRDTIRNIARENGRSVAAPGVRTRLLNGVGGLSPHDPALNALLDVPIAVPFHSIIPQIHFLGHDLHTDGIVRYESAHLDGAESEKLTTGIHGTHDSWEVSQEVRRILREHLQSVDQSPAGLAAPTANPSAQTVPQSPSSR